MTDGKQPESSLHSQELWTAAEEDLNKKRALRTEENDYYVQRSKDLSLSSFDDVIPYLDEPGRFATRGIVYAHNDFGAILDAILNEQPWAVVSGLNPSGPLHFGHKAMLDVLLWLQQSYGATIYIPITNDESYLVGKAQSVSMARKTAYEQVIPSIIALGFDPSRTRIFVHSDFPGLYQLAVSVSRHATYNSVRSLFGWNGSENPGMVFYMGALQSASILMPQLPEYGGPKPVLVPVGIDQHPYIALARDLAHKMHIHPPSELVWKFLFGLRGPNHKMSTSEPDSAIFLTDTKNDAIRKLRRAFSGGSIVAEYQKLYGSVPEVDSAFNLLMYNFLTDDEFFDLQDRYRSGELMSAQVKDIAIDHVVAFLETHREERERARDRIGEFLIHDDLPFLNQRDEIFDRLEQ